MVNDPTPLPQETVRQEVVRQEIIRQEVIRKRRGIYLLPNLFTTAGLFAGFYAIVAAMNGHFETAAIAIFVAMITDSLDGRVARLTGTQTAFGAEYDSLSDMVAFGIAPALVIYSWSLSSLAKIGWVAAFLYAAATALRLARFNTQVGTADKRFFQGLASPAAAALLAGLVWLGVSFDVAGSYWRWPAFVLTLVAAGLMVSRVRYYSFKDLDFKGHVSFWVVLGMVLVFVFISIDPPRVLFTLFMLYAISGPILTFKLLRRSRKEK